MLHLAKGQEAMISSRQQLRKVNNSNGQKKRSGGTRDVRMLYPLWRH